MAIDGGAGAAEREAQRVWSALDGFRIEVPSWGFANTGTRFGKFVQGGAATTIEEKFSDAAQVNALTGASPTVALHVLWDLPGGKADVPAIQGLEKKYGVKAGSINPNLFQDAEYKYGSIANSQRGEFAAMRWRICWTRWRLGVSLGRRMFRCGLQDGSNAIPGRRVFASRIADLWKKVLAATHAALGEGQRMLVEYKPFEPAFYHTDIADWGVVWRWSWRGGRGRRRRCWWIQGIITRGPILNRLWPGCCGWESWVGSHFNDRKIC